MSGPGGGDGTYSYSGSRLQGPETVTEVESGTWTAQADGKSVEIAATAYTVPETRMLNAAELVPVVFLDEDTIVIGIDGYLVRQP